MSAGAPFFPLVACETCGVPAGAVCKRPSGHAAWPPHASRVYATEWALERAGMPRGYYEFAGRGHVRLAQPIGDVERIGGAATPSAAGAGGPSRGA